MSGISGLLDVVMKDGVRVITMTDIRTRNSLSMKMLEALNSAVADDSSLRCILLRAEGNVFSAGHNLKEIHSGNIESHRAVFESCNRLMLRLRSLPVPVIAQVDGIAAAAGCQLVAACDIVVASDTSSFSTPGGSVGIFCSTPGVPLVRNVPRKLSSYMLLTGSPISAQTAFTAGLVSLVVPKDKLEEETQCVVESIVSKSRAVLALGKRFMYQQAELTEENAYKAGADVMVNNINMADGQEGICSFVEKRKPHWTHED
ncbi:enoyl-CoA hydratase domain-containing protein 3, mitochondrial isoform X2 [Hyalella azteca]|nr:enoyl-CoA hydratase domain-containing protein 3, mitochondrial isoform X2 [Hyalella azteca]